MNPLVSVIIPTYGGNISIINSIKSVLNQTYDNFEIIIVDDNDPSSEARKRTEEYLLEFKDNEKVKYIKHAKNLNGSAARNTGFKNSLGTYITLLDDDDIYYPNKISEEVEFLNNNLDFGGCYCFRKQNGKIIESNYEGDLSKVILDLSFTPTTPSLMFRRECYENLNGFDETYRRHQDFEFLLRFFKKYKLGVVKKVLIEIIGNDINNCPKGKKLYDLKKYFFNQFSNDINYINSIDKGFKKRVYARHCSSAFKDMIRYGNIITAIKFYFVFGIKGGLLFWKLFFKHCFGGIKERLSRGKKCE